MGAVDPEDAVQVFAYEFGLGAGDHVSVRDLTNDETIKHVSTFKIGPVVLTWSLLPQTTGTV